MRYTHQQGFYLWLFLLSTLCSCLSTSQSSKQSSNKEDVPKDETFVIKNVNIIPMTLENKVIPNASILIKNKKIIAINETIPAEAKLIDGKGKWLMPGLIDMHVHNLADINLSENYPTKGATFFPDTQDFMFLYVANGVTTAFELGARAEHFGQRNDIIKGKVIGPRIALAIMIDGGDASGNVANTASDGRQTVRIAKAQGYEFIKVYSRLNIETYKAIIDEAAKQNMKVVGHIPNVFKGRIEEAFVPHFELVAHAEEFAKQADSFTYEEATRFATLAKQNGTWLTPTLITMEMIAAQSRSLDSVRNLPGLKYVHPLLQSKWLTSNNYNRGTTPERVAYLEKLVHFNMMLVKAFKEAGVPIVAGSDAGTSGVVWGFSLHNELELLVKAGLTPAEALASATRLPADWLKIGDKIGTIKAGKFADLLLLDANPLENISNIRKIAAVVVNGRWVDKEKIDTMLSAIAKRNEAGKDKFGWKKRADF